MSDFEILTRCAVVSTSTSSLDTHLSRDEMLHILRLQVHQSSTQENESAKPFLKETIYADGLDLSSEAFYQKLSSDPNSTWTTLPPSVENIQNLLYELEQQDYQEAIIITLSHHLSETADIIRHTVLQMDLKMRVYLVDTGTICIPEGFFALEAIRLLREGMMPEDIVQYLEKLRNHTEIVFSVHSLEYLQKNGRLNRTSQKFAEWLNLKPILQFRNGVLMRMGLVRGRISTFDFLTQHTLEKIANGKQWQIYGLYGGNTQLYEQFSQYFQQTTGLSLMAYPISPVVGVHIGPNAIGVGLIEKI